MQVQYGKPSAAYICSTRHRRYGEPLCQSLTIDHVDRAVTAAFLQVIGPAQVDAALALSEELERDRAAVERQWELRLERARYEVERAFRQYDLCEPDNRLVARELEGRWNEQLRSVAELEAAYRREQNTGLSRLTGEEKEQVGQLVGDLPALWSAPGTTTEDRKRLVRCLIREVVLLRDDRRRATGGVTTIRLGWCSGAWSELQVHRPNSGEAARTAPQVLERIQSLAQQYPDEQVAAMLNAEGVRTRMDFAWTSLRVGQVRLRYGIPTACPIMPAGPGPRGDGRVSVETVMAQMGVSRSVVGTWCRDDFLDAEQLTPLGPRWIQLTDEDRARLDGTRAAQGYGRWRLREAQRVLNLSAEELHQHVRDGKLIPYRAHIGDHWEWRIDAADQPQQKVSIQPVDLQFASEEVE